ncbi:hypothetical protein J0L40_00700 [Stenotrophomonas maltophilia]|nr:hypothetical protein [Stenotrophomonas maltophilia]
MQRVTATVASPLTLSQALAPASAKKAVEAAAAVVPVMPAGPTLAEEREQVLAQARQEGLCKGEADATARFEQRVAAARAELDAVHAERMQDLATQQEQLNAMLTALPAALEQLQARTLEDAAVLAFEVATQLYGGVDGIDFPGLCAQLLQEQTEHPVVLRVAPAQVAAVTSLAGTAVRVVASAGLSPGQVQVQTTSGAVDGGLDVRLDAIRSAFLTSLSGATT